METVVVVPWTLPATMWLLIGLGVVVIPFGIFVCYKEFMAVWKKDD